MENLAMTDMDRAIWMMVGGQNSLEIENACRDADRADARIMYCAVNKPFLVNAAWPQQHGATEVRI